jgi:hypothetical protein
MFYIYSSGIGIYCGNYEEYKLGEGYPSGTVIGLELNTMTGILYFFINNKQIMHCVNTVPKGVCFGV